VQRRAWRQALSGRGAEELLAAISADQMAAAWHSAITRPPNARCRVLVALAGAAEAESRLVGFASTIPSADDDAGPADGAIEEFALDPVAQRRGHGSRLLHACVDTLRADGFQHASWWVGADNDVLRAFLADAGWAPDGAWREIGADAGDAGEPEIRIKQIRLHSDISSSDISSSDISSLSPARPGRLSHHSPTWRHGPPARSTA
jgi:GNAT superfamily N-acetyltransferase